MSAKTIRLHEKSRAGIIKGASLVADAARVVACALGPAVLKPSLRRRLRPAEHARLAVGARHLMRDYEEAALATIMKYIKTWAEMPGV